MSIPEQYRTNAMEFLGVKSETVEQLKSNVLKFVEYYDHIPVGLASLNRRFSKDAKRLGTSVKVLVVELEREGLVGIRLNAKANRTFVYNDKLYQRCIEKIQGLVDTNAFENTEKFA